MLHRRQMLIGLGAAGALALSARAEIACNMFQGRQVCQAGLQFAPDVRTAPQECPYWCWAACIEAAFAVRGYTVSQSDIVTRLFGGLVCAPADGAVIARTLTGSWHSKEGQTFHAQAGVLIDGAVGIARPDAALIAADELRSNRPLIIGTTGHAMLMTAMTYAVGSWSGPDIWEVIVRDPWPTSPNRRSLSPMEIAQIQFLTTVRVG